MSHRFAGIVVALLACAGALGTWLVLGVERESVGTKQAAHEAESVRVEHDMVPGKPPDARASLPADSWREGGAEVGTSVSAPADPMPPDAFHGLVLDGRTLEPLAGVELYWRGTELAPPTPGTRCEAPEATTGADGRFALERRSGSVAWLELAGYGTLGFTIPASKTKTTSEDLRRLFEEIGEVPPDITLFDLPAEEELALPPDETAVFRLHPPAALELVLDRPRDSPCREMRVQLRELPAPAHDCAPQAIRLFPVLREGRLDAEGRVRFTEVRALAPHTVLLGARDLELALEAEPSRVTTVALACGLVPLEGIATDPSGRALEGVAIEAGATAATEIGPRANLRLCTDATGRFGFSSLTAGTWWLHARSEDGRFGALERVELVDEPVRMRLVLAPTLILAGSVLRADGEPATGVVTIRSVAHPEHEFQADVLSNGSFRAEVWLDEEFEVGVHGSPGSTQRAWPGRGELLLRVPIQECLPPAPREHAWHEGLPRD
jgi:hypothetical protein